MASPDFVSPPPPVSEYQIKADATSAWFCVLYISIFSDVSNPNIQGTTEKFSALPKRDSNITSDFWSFG